MNAFKLVLVTLLGSAVVAVIVGILYGYVMNIVLLVSHTGTFALLEAARILGIFIPIVGAVLGYC